MVEPSFWEQLESHLTKRLGARGHGSNTGGIARNNSMTVLGFDSSAW